METCVETSALETSENDVYGMEPALVSTPDWQLSLATALATVGQVRVSVTQMSANQTCEPRCELADGMHWRVRTFAAYRPAYSGLRISSGGISLTQECVKLLRETANFVVTEPVTAGLVTRRRYVLLFFFMAPQKLSIESRAGINQAGIRRELVA